MRNERIDDEFIKPIKFTTDDGQVFICDPNEKMTLSKEDKNKIIELISNVRAY